MLPTWQTAKPLLTIKWCVMKEMLWVTVVLYFSVQGLVSCSRKDSAKEDHRNHIEVTQDMPGMDMLTLTKRDEQYANIRTDTVKTKPIAEYTTLLGTTNFDETKITVVTSRVPGRIDKLFARNPQQFITQGQPLYSIYSEELLSNEHEYLNALQQREQFSSMRSVIDKLIEGARQKLLLWGLSAQQLAVLEKTGKASPLITFNSTVSGSLVELSVGEGQYVETGTPLFRIADLSQLWIEAQMYTDELRWLYEQPSITAEFEAYPGESFKLKPVFNNPGVEADQKISLVRFLFANKEFPIKPGMMVYVNIKRNEKRALVIPKSSILIGNMITAWVKSGDGMYENRMIRLGIQNKKEVEVLDGLKEGEIVVTSGAYLLNSALVLKNGAGMAGMDGMKM
jgi:Cu(I)/Ag(I) efflux system membrane fusion protein